MTHRGAGPAAPAYRTVCWVPVWNADYPGIGLEYLLLGDREADSVLLAVDDDRGPFRLAYRLAWDDAWRLRSADLVAHTSDGTRTLHLRTDGAGRWEDAADQPLTALDGCLDIDIWPTPFTNSFPIRRERLAVAQRTELRMAWVFAPTLTVEPKPQAYTRLGDHLYRYENLDGSGFATALPVDDDGVVLDYPGLFRRLG